MVVSATSQRTTIIIQTESQQIVVGAPPGGRLSDVDAQLIAFMNRYGSIDPYGAQLSGPMSKSQHLNVGLDNFDLLDTAAGIGERDGIIGRADLQAILEAPDVSPRLKAAARYMLDHFSELDDAAGNKGEEDGKISRDDLMAGIADAGMNEERAIDTIQGNFAQFDTAGHGGWPDGLVSRDDLEAVAGDENASPETRAAARYALAHPEFFDRVDTAGHGGDKDGLISMDDLAVGREQIGLDAPASVQNVYNFFDTIDDAAGNKGENDGLFSRSDLEAIVENDDAPPDVKASARYLLDHPEIFDTIDTAGHGGDRDGLISRDDLLAWMSGGTMDPSCMCMPNPVDALRGGFALLDTAAYGGDGDGLVSRDDLAAAVANPNTPPQLRAAAQWALEHPEAFDQLDTAGHGGDKDGLVSMDDLDVGREMYGMTDVQALQITQDNFRQFDTAAHGGDPDGLVSRSDLEAITEDDNASPQAKAAAHWLLDHPEAFDEIDTAGHGGDKDGLVSQDDLRAYLRNHAPDISMIPMPLPPTGGPADQDPFGDPFQNEIEDILTDPTLTVEDQVTLFLMLVAKKMDKQIEEQMRYINSLQQQQNKASGPPGSQQGTQPGAQPGLPPQAGPSGQDSSIDIETLKLKRLIDKRSQLFDTLRQIIDKYNMTAKGIIDTMNR
jgi:hypothetical protein